MALPTVHRGARGEASVEIADWSRESRVAGVDCDVAVQCEGGMTNRTNAPGRVSGNGRVTVHFNIPQNAQVGGTYRLTFSMSRGDGAGNTETYGEPVSDSGPIG